MKNGFKKGLAVLGLSVCMTGALAGCTSKLNLNEEKIDNLITQSTEFFENQKVNDNRLLLEQKLVNFMAQQKEIKCYQMEAGQVAYLGGLKTGSDSYTYKYSVKENKIYELMTTYAKGQVRENIYQITEYDGNENSYSGKTYDLVAKNYYNFDGVDGGLDAGYDLSSITMTILSAVMNDTHKVTVGLERLENGEDRFYFGATDDGSDEVASFEIIFKDDKLVKVVQERYENDGLIVDYFFNFDYENVTDFEVDVSNGYSEIENPNAE